MELAGISFWDIYFPMLLALITFEAISFVISFAITRYQFRKMREQNNFLMENGTGFPTDAQGNPLMVFDFNPEMFGANTEQLPTTVSGNQGEEPSHGQYL